MLEFLFSKLKRRKSFINFIENVRRVDLNLLFTGGSNAAILLQVSGGDNIFGISDGDLVMIDRSKTPKQGDIVLKTGNDSHYFERCKSYNRRGLYLVPKNPPPVIVKDEIYGVITHIIKQLV